MTIYNLVNPLNVYALAQMLWHYFNKCLNLSIWAVHFVLYDKMGVTSTSFDRLLFKRGGDASLSVNRERILKVPP